MTTETIQIIELVMGLITFMLSCFCIIPQIFILYKTRNSSGISLFSLFLLCFDNILWIVWTFGFYFNSMLMYDKEPTRIFQTGLIILCFAYVFGSVLVFYSLFCKIKNVLLAKKLKVTELELAKILVNKDKKKYFINGKWNNNKRFFVPMLLTTLIFLLSFTMAAMLYVFAFVQPVKGTKEWVWVIVISFLASILYEISCWPQLYRSIKYRDTTGISIFWAVFAAVNCLVTFAYDLSLSFSSGWFNWDVLFVLIFSAMIPNIGVMIVKLKNLSAAKKANMTEVEYTKKVLIPQVKAKLKKKKSKKCFS